jgi:putative flippase GtrA
MGFCIVGVSNTVVSYIIYLVTLKMLPDKYIVANTLGFIVGVIWSYIWNSKLVFEKDPEDCDFKTNAIKLTKTYIINIISVLVISNIMLGVWINIAHVSYKIAPIMNVLITTPINFAVNKLWIHKE